MRAGLAGEVRSSQLTFEDGGAWTSSPEEKQSRRDVLAEYSPVTGTWASARRRWKNPEGRLKAITTVLGLLDLIPDRITGVKRVLQPS